MAVLRALVLDDQAQWRKEIQTALETFGEWITIDSFSSLDAAADAVQTQFYDLAVVDLSLLGFELEDPKSADELGIEFLEVLRNHPRNRDCGVVVATGYPTTERILRLQEKYRVSCILEKGDTFTDEALLDAVRVSVRVARHAKAERLDTASPRLTLELDHDGVRRAEVRKGNQASTYSAKKPIELLSEDLTRTADMIGLSLLTAESNSWRVYAGSVERLLRSAIAGDGAVQASFATAGFAAAGGDERVRYRIDAPASALGIPFELLRPGGSQDEHLCLAGPVWRRITSRGTRQFKKIEAFHRFLNRMGKDGRTVRMLLVAANADGKIPQADKEVESLAPQVRSDFGLAGIDIATTVLGYDEATYDAVKERLASGNFHMFHYAGHGVHQIHQPAKSGLPLEDRDTTGVLFKNAKLRTLTGEQLRLLTAGTSLRFVFLSCCLTAQSAPHAQQGDLHGVFDALARADVPFVLGHRWVVGDNPARFLARTFYRRLSQTFSLAEALHLARVACADRYGRDDPTWASPVLLAQH